MHYLLFFIISIAPSITAYSSDSCPELNVSGVFWGSTIDEVKEALGPFTQSKKISDTETSGQYSGWEFSKEGLTVFIADIGGLMSAHITSNDYLVANNYRVGEVLSGYGVREKVEIHLCANELSMTEKTRIQLRSAPLANLGRSS